MKSYEHKKRVSDFFKGKTPPNKGKECPVKLKKIEKFKKNIPILCKVHGEHLEWRLHTGNNVQCKRCAAMWQRVAKKKSPLKIILKDARQHSKKRKIDFDIVLKDLEKIYESQKGACNLTGIKFSDQMPPSLDKIDPQKGYLVDNVQLVLIKVNIMKSNLKQDEFINLCKNVYLKTKNKGRKASKKPKKAPDRAYIGVG